MDSPAPVTRRTLLRGATAAGAALVVGACTLSDAGSPTPTNTSLTSGASASTGSSVEPTSPPEGDVLLVERALADVDMLADYCGRTGRRHRELRGAVDPLRGRLVAQREGLLGALTQPPSDLPSPRRIGVPESPRAAGRRLTAELSAAADRASGACVEAESGLLARVFASLSASHAASVELVRSSG